MVEVRVRFWTNNLPKTTQDGKSPNALAWESGMCYVVTNKELNVPSSGPVAWNGLEDLARAVAKATALSSIATVKYGRVRKPRHEK